MSGTYRSLNLDELVEAFQGLPEAAQVFRPIVSTGESVDPADAQPGVFLAALGPELISTDQRLVPLSSLPIWDVNGYYRAIGVEWPYQPTRQQMREGYTRVDGQSDDYATYSLKRLLDKSFREHYDRRGLGEPVDDPYRWRQAFMLASAWAAEQSRVTGMVVSSRDLFGEDLMAKLEREAEAERQAEDIENSRFTQHDPESGTVGWSWPYAYYQWGSRQRNDETLAQWQRLLVESFCRRGLSLRFAVGYFGRGHGSAARMRHRRQGGFIEILFLHEDVEPSPKLADVVVGSYRTYPYGYPLTYPLHLNESR